MDFSTEKSIKKFFLPFFHRRTDFPCGYKRRQYFDTILCLYNSKEHSYIQRKKLSQKFREENQFCNSKYVELFITTCIGINEEVIFTPPFIAINIGVPFIFDKRLIPQSLDGYHVNQSVCGVPLRYFPYIDNVRFTDRFRPEKIIEFVENHFALISRKLEIPGLTNNEALDALTGGYSEYVRKIDKLRSIGL